MRAAARSPKHVDFPVLLQLNHAFMSVTTGCIIVTLAEELIHFPWQCIFHTFTFLFLLRRPRTEGFAPGSSRDAGI